MSKWERGLAVISALLACFGFADQYVFKSKLIDLLLAPIGIPAAAIFAIPAVFVLIVIVLRRPPANIPIVQSESDKDLVSELTAIRKDKAALESQLAEMRLRLDQLSSLRAKVIAVLASKEATPYDMLREMMLDTRDAKNMHNLLDTVGILVQEGVVGQGSMSSYYKLLRQANVGQIGNQEKVICYRDTIRLIHKTTGHALHSHNILYTHPNSSRQQQVTAFAGSDLNDYWIVKGHHGLDQYANKGRPVSRDEIIRLEHQNTRKNLHSHRGHPSPVSGQQEVTALGKDGLGDNNDNWRVDTLDEGVWRENVAIRLIHQLTDAALHSHSGISHQQYTAGQQEVTCFQTRDANDLWIAVKIGNINT